MKRVAIIGAGAAGCFCAGFLSRGGAQVTVFEAGKKPLAKVAVTGGGRCNLSNDFEGIRSLSDAYPRGERLMQRALKVFSVADTLQWFQAAGVPCVLQEDHCWFPRSQDAMDVVRALLMAMQGADLRLNTPVTGIYSEPTPCRSERSEESIGPFVVSTPQDDTPFDFVVITTGGASKGLPFLEGLNLEIIPPVPSLFTFTVKDPALNALSGLVVPARVGIPGSRFKADGPLLITDWGLSGPAALKLSSYAARYLAEQAYTAPVAINWLDRTEEEVKALLLALAAESPQKQVRTTHGALPSRLWEHLTVRAGLRPDIKWAEMGQKGLNRLTAALTADTYAITGKSKFREEFVTAGGVALSNLNLNTLESKQHKGLYFAGEVLDIDAITGGFNLQAAWSTGFMVAQSILNSL